MQVNTTFTCIQRWRATVNGRGAASWNHGILESWNLGINLWEPQWHRTTSIKLITALSNYYYFIKLNIYNDKKK